MNNKLFHYFAFRNLEVVKNNFFMFIRSFVAIVSSLLMISEVVQYTIDVSHFPVWGLLLIILASAFAALFWTCICIKKQDIFEIELEDYTSLTIAVGDYIKNVYRFSGADCVFGCNNKFNLKTVKKHSLQDDIIREFYVRNNYLIERYEKNYNRQGKSVENKLEKLKFETAILEENSAKYKKNEAKIELLEKRLQQINEAKQRVEESYNKDIEQTQNMIDEFWRKKEGEIVEKQVNMDVKEKEINNTEDGHQYGEIAYIPLKGSQNVMMFANSTLVAKVEEVNKENKDTMNYNGRNKTIEELKKIWEYYIDNGIMKESVLIPLLGTGNSHDNTHIAAAKRIIDLYFENKKENDVSGIKSVIISIHPNDIINHKIDLEEVKWYAISKAMENGMLKKSMIKL